MATTLISATAASKIFTFTFNKAVALSTIGMLTDSYRISTVTPNAVVPIVTSVEAVGNQVIIHTTEQTTGATYTIDVSPGSIYAIS